MSFLTLLTLTLLLRDAAFAAASPKKPAPSGAMKPPPAGKPGTAEAKSPTAGETETKAKLTLLTLSFETDAFRRFMHSAGHFGYEVRVLDLVKKLGEEAQPADDGATPKTAGGETNPAAGYKCNLIKSALEEIKAADEDRLVMFTDGRDVLINDKPEVVAAKFAKMDAGVVFAADMFIWPDDKLESRYPKVKKNMKRFLNSGGVIGKVKDLLAVVSATPKELIVNQNEDDQLFLTLVYLDEALRKKHNLKLDHDRDIFANLNGAKEEIVLAFAEGTGRPLAHDKVSEKNSSVLIEDGPNKLNLNWFGNYMANSWTESRGCTVCASKIVVDTLADVKTLPKILLALFVDRKTPALTAFFQRLMALRYPKGAIDVFVFSGMPEHHAVVEEFKKNVTSPRLAATDDVGYASFQVLVGNTTITNQVARESAFRAAVTLGSDYVFAVDSIAQISNAETLKLLIEADRPIVAPLLTRPAKLWSNFWGDLDAQGWYSRSPDYIQIIEKDRLGIWNVPYIANAILTHKSKFGAENIPIFHHQNFDQDMGFCADQRRKGNFLFVSNLVAYGHLVDPDVKLHDEL